MANDQSAEAAIVSAFNAVRGYDGPGVPGASRAAAAARDDAARARLREAADRMSPLSPRKPTSLDIALVRDAAYRLSEAPDHAIGGVAP